ncbi:MAG: hypothetical protein R2795_26865 [Saprospiraceae bacterium]
MKKSPLFFILGICIFVWSCRETSNIEGRWQAVFFNNDATANLEFFFNDFEFYNSPQFVPQIQIMEDSIEYALGIGADYSSKAYKYSLSDDNQLTLINCNSEQSFGLKFITEEVFCLLNGEVEVVCFTKVGNVDKCQNYSLELTITSEYYTHDLSILSDGNIFLKRNGVKTDSVHQMLNLYTQKRISTLVNLINMEEVMQSIQTVGGDYTEYELTLYCGESIMHRKFSGLRDIPFAMKALLVNLEHLSKTVPSSS